MNQERISTPTKPFGGLRSRYHAYLEKHKEPVSPARGARFGQGAINFVIFCSLLVAILTVFGIGLSWFGGSRKVADAQSSQSAGAEASASALPSQPAGPAGHAEVRSQSAPSKKTDGK
ncbi:MAG: hypothetical protein AB7U82_27230 [Blastocatellales bacterium]